MQSSFQDNATETLASKKVLQDYNTKVITTEKITTCFCIAKQDVAIQHRPVSSVLSSEYPEKI